VIDRFVPLTVVLGLFLSFQPVIAQEYVQQQGPVTYVEQSVNTPPTTVCPVNGCPNCQQCEIPLVTPLACWLIKPNAYILSSDHGWSYVIKRPIVTQNITYQHYWPQASQAAKNSRNRVPVSAYPMVAQPTDTMQLGYYYQHAPRWQPRPDMLPRPPIPSQWHIRKCGYRADGSYVVWVPLSRLPRQVSPVQQQQPPQPQTSPAKPSPQGSTPQSTSPRPVPAPSGGATAMKPLWQRAR